MLTDPQIEAIRSQFPILREKAYFYSNSLGAFSEAVEEGLREYVSAWRTAPDPWVAWMETYESLRGEFARFINARPEEVAIVASVSAGINPIASALPFDRRNKVVMSEYEFPTVGHIWLAQRPRGAKVQFLDGVNETIPMECYERAIDQQTAIVPLTQVSFLNGFRTDAAAIARLAHSRGALVFLDGYQDCGTRPVDVKALDVDFYVTGTLKYLLGPPGLAFLYVRRELVESLTPTNASWMGQREPFAFRTKCLDFAPDARRFEGGTPPIPSICMARRALQLLNEIGMDNVAAQIERLAGAFAQGAGNLRIALKTSPPHIGPLIVVQAKDAEALRAKLVQRSVIVSARGDGVRFAFHVYNTLDDIHRGLAALKDNLDLLVRT